MNSKEGRTFGNAWMYTALIGILKHVNIRVLGATTLAQAGGSRAIMAPGGGGLTSKRLWPACPVTVS